MEVSVSILFSKNKKVGSWIIRAGTNHLSSLPFKQVPSHVAILVNNRWVHESTLDSGVRVITYQKWLEINEEVANIPYSNLEYSKIKTFYRETETKKYDWMGVTYLGLFCGITKFFPFIKKPNTNLFSSDNKYFCTEVIGKLFQENMDMLSPVELKEKLINRS